MNTIQISLRHIIQRSGSSPCGFDPYEDCFTCQGVSFGSSICQALYIYCTLTCYTTSMVGDFCPKKLGHSPGNRCHLSFFWQLAKPDHPSPRKEKEVLSFCVSKPHKSSILLNVKGRLSWPAATLRHSRDKNAWWAKSGKRIEDRKDPASAISYHNPRKIFLEVPYAYN